MMVHKYLKLISISPALLIFLAGTINVTSASMNMDDLKIKFKEETGKKWSEVTSDERRDFMYKVRGHEKKAEREKRVEGVRTPFYIREGFRKEYKRLWEDATEEEQEEFIEDYKRLKKEWEKEEKERLEEEEDRLKKIEQEKRKKEMEAKRKKQKKEKKKREELAELERKRQEEKKRLEDSKRERNKLLKKLKDMRKSRNRKTNNR